MLNLLNAPATMLKIPLRRHRVFQPGVFHLDAQLVQVAASKIAITSRFDELIAPAIW